MVNQLLIASVSTASRALALLVARLIGHAPTTAAMTSEGYQEATITVNGRYRPDNIRLEKGTPVRLHFVRMEDDPCSERVIFSGVGLDRRLPAFRKTTVEFIPKSSGTFLFTCQWGMYRGKLLVTEPGVRSKAARRAKSGVKNGGSEPGR